MPAYFFQERGGKYVVGRMPELTQVEFDDRFIACAYFIIKSVNLIS